MRCKTCGQIDWGQTGENPCNACGLAVDWDEGQSPPSESEDVFRQIALGNVPERMTAEQFAFSQSDITATQQTRGTTTVAR